MHALFLLEDRFGIEPCVDGSIFRFFVESYRRNHGTEPEVTGNRVVSKQDLLSGMHMVSAERNSTTGRKVEKDE